jgi:UDP-N-acetylmuramate dehydrogenase
VKDALDLHEDFDLTDHNTLRLPSRADLAIRVRSIAEVQAALAWCRRRELTVTVIGGGSNVVLQPRVSGCVLLPDLRWIRRYDTNNIVRLQIGAGVRWHDLVRYSLGQGLTGIENLALIPGNVGGAPIQNIGAYGVELDSVLQSVTAVAVDSGEVIELSRADCDFGYRDSCFRRSSATTHVIVQVTLSFSGGRPVAHYPDVALELTRMGLATVRAVDVAEAVIHVRRRKLPDPRRVPNAGSFFKNPIVAAAHLETVRAGLGGAEIVASETATGVKLPAARLIEACGFKQRPSARVAVWHRQALVLINSGGADANDVLDFAGVIQHAVAQRFGVVLELEPRIIGAT